MKDQINLYQNYELLFQKNCSSCQEKKSNHLIFQCPLINFTCKKHLLIAKNNFSFSQKRSNFSRRKKKTPLFYIPFNKTKKKIVSSHLIPRCQTNPELNHLLIQPIGIQKCQSSPKLFADDRLNFKKNPLDLENFNKKKIELDILEDPDVLSKNSEIQIILDKDYDMEPIQNQIKLDFNLFKEKDYSKVEIDPYNYSDADEDKSEACSPKNLKKLYNFDKNYQNESSEEEDCEENNPNSFESAVEKSLEETKINKKQNKTKIDPNFRILKEFDKMHLFDKYFPLGNYTIVLWNLERKPKIFGNKRKKLFKNKRDSLSSLVKAWKSSSKRKSNKI